MCTFVEFITIYIMLVNSANDKNKNMDTLHEKMLENSRIIRLFARITETFLHHVIHDKNEKVTISIGGSNARLIHF